MFPAFRSVATAASIATALTVLTAPTAHAALEYSLQESDGQYSCAASGQAREHIDGVDRRYNDVLEFYEYKEFRKDLAGFEETLEDIQPFYFKMLRESGWVLTPGEIQDPSFDRSKYNQEELDKYIDFYYRFEAKLGDAYGFDPYTHYPLMSFFFPPTAEVPHVLSEREALDVLDPTLLADDPFRNVFNKETLDFLKKRWDTPYWRGIQTGHVPGEVSITPLPDEVQWPQRWKTRFEQRQKVLFQKKLEAAKPQAMWTLNLIDNCEKLIKQAEQIKPTTTTATTSATTTSTTSTSSTSSAKPSTTSSSVSIQKPMFTPTPEPQKPAEPRKESGSSSLPLPYIGIGLFVLIATMFTFAMQAGLIG